jgi:hypothetical protein
MNKIIFAVIAILMVISAKSQTVTGFYENGYIHLKNGTVLKGRYIYSSDLEKLRVQSGKNTWVFDASEVELISKNRPSRDYSGGEEFMEHTISPPKFFSLTEAGVLSGNPENSQSAPLVLGTQFNYTFWKNLSAGAGAGIEFLKETYMPLTANVLYKLRNTGFTPYAILQAGYQVPLEDSRMLYYDIIPDYVSSRVIWPWPVTQTPMKAKGGMLFNPAVGFMSHFRSGYGFSLSVGYRFHRLRYSGEGDYNLDVDFNRLSVKLGFIIN